MKIFNKLSAAMLVLPLMAGLTACHDEHAEYNAAQALSNAQVFFSEQTLNTTTRELDMNAASFVIPIQRVDTVGELTVNLENRQDAASTTKLNVPESVTFENGKATAEIIITYDPATIDFEDINRDTLVIADAQYTTPYGGTEYRFGALIPLPWTDWVYTATAFASEGGQGDFPLGTSGDGKGDYLYGGMYFDGDDPGLPISFRQNKLNPQQGEFKIEHWGRDVDFVMPAEWDEDRGIWRIFVPLTPIGADYQDLGPIYVCDYIAFYDLMGRDPLTWEILERNGLECSYDPKTGKFSLFVRYVIGDGRGFGEGEESFQVHGFYIPDYSAVPSFLGILTDKESVPYAQVDVTFGADVQKALAYVVENGDDTGAVADALAAGDIEGIELVSGINNFPLGDQVGALKVVVASIVDDEVVYSNAVNFEYYGGGKNPWQSLGMGIWTEPLVSDFYEAAEVQDVEVEIRESEDAPGLYRIMDPYGANWYLASANAMTPCEYVEVNAEDPQGVYVLPQMLGVDVEGSGNELGLASLGGYFYSNGNTLEELKGAGYLGVNNAGVITLPTFASGDDPSAENYYTYQGIFIYGTKAYYGMNNFRVVLPEAVTNSARAKAKAAGFARRMKMNQKFGKPQLHKTDVRRRMPNILHRLNETVLK